MTVDSTTTIVHYLFTWLDSEFSLNKQWNETALWSSFILDQYSTNKYLVVCLVQNIESQYEGSTAVAVYEVLLQKPAANHCVVTCFKHSLLLVQLQQFFAQKYFGSWSGTPFVIVFPTENVGRFDLLLAKKTVLKIAQLTARIWRETTCFQHGCVQQPIIESWCGCWRNN